MAVTGAAGVPSEMTARQRKHVYMHSTIFDAEGPAPNSVYAPSRQHELYGRFSDKLRAANRGQPPELEMPSALDMRCTQNAGHNAVLPGGPPQQAMPAAGARPTREVLLHDGEAKPVIHAAGKDESIPKEFWSTSTTLQWHDTRNEQCRGRNQAVDRQGLGAQELKLQELSSEVFGKARLVEASTATRTARHELMPDSADYLRVDSALHAPKMSQPPEGERRPAAAAAEARARLHQNLASSANNSMPVPEGAPQGPIEVPPLGDDPSNVDRRRQEKNFSDLFGAQMGERREVRGSREEVTGSHTCSFLDTRCEIANRNKEHWRQDQHQSPSRRKDAERDSTLFDFDCPEKPALGPELREVHRQERSCWESKDGMQAATETARRRRMKDHLHDFEGQVGCTHVTRKQESLASTQMRLGMGAAPEPREAWVAPAGPAPRRLAAAGYGGAAGRGPSPGEREALLRSAKDTKLASLQSVIFS